MKRYQIPLEFRIDIVDRALYYSHPVGVLDVLIDVGLDAHETAAKAGPSERAKERSICGSDVENTGFGGYAGSVQIEFDCSLRQHAVPVELRILEDLEMIEDRSASHRRTPLRGGPL